MGNIGMFEKNLYDGGNVLHYNDDDMIKFVRLALNDLVRGDLYMKYGLDDKSVGRLIIKEGNRNQVDKNFLTVVSDKITKEDKMENKKFSSKREKKKMIKLIVNSMEDLISKEIRLFMKKEGNAECADGDQSFQNDLKSGKS